jgi:hypothetical protein
MDERSTWMAWSTRSCACCSATHGKHWSARAANPWRHAKRTAAPGEQNARRYLLDLGEVEVGAVVVVGARGEDRRYRCRRERAAHCAHALNGAAPLLFEEERRRRLARLSFEADILVNVVDVDGPVHRVHRRGRDGCVALLRARNVVPWPEASRKISVTRALPQSTAPSHATYGIRGPTYDVQDATRPLRSRRRSLLRRSCAHKCRQCGHGCASLRDGTCAASTCAA